MSSALGATWPSLGSFIALYVVPDTLKLIATRWLAIV